jgi:hypothetical protein
VSVIGAYPNGFKIGMPFLHTTQVVGDGIANIIVGLEPTNGQNVVLFGTNSTADFALHSNSFMVTPAVSYDFSGRSVSLAGDVNGDGYDDLIVGVPYASLCYVLFGNRFGFTNMTKGFTIYGVSTSDQTGWSVSGAGA